MQVVSDRFSLHIELENEIEELEKSFEEKEEKIDGWDVQVNGSQTAERFRRIDQKFSECECEFYRVQWLLVYRFARISYEHGNFDLAEKYFKTVLRLMPGNENGCALFSLQMLGYVLLRRKAYKEAISYFKKCLEDGNGHHRSDVKSRIYNGMAYAHFGRNRFAEAISCAEKAVQHSLDAKASAGSYFLLAFCNGIRMDKKKERRYTSRLLRVGEDNPNLDYLV